MTNFDFYKTSLEALPKLKEALKNTAVKNKISPEALIILLSLNNGTDLSFLVKEDYINELLNFGFADNKEQFLKITGKGAILAKSLERIL